MLQISDTVKTSKHAKRLYVVIGFDIPLPDMGGVAKVILKSAAGKSRAYRRVDARNLFNVDGTRIKLN